MEPLHVKDAKIYIIFRNYNFNYKLVTVEARYCSLKIFALKVIHVQIRAETRT